MTGLPDFCLLDFRLPSSVLPASVFWTSAFCLLAFRLPSSGLPFSLLPFFSSKKALIFNYFYYLCIII